MQRTGRVEVATYDQALFAVQMLHEQAHGATPFRTCMQEPCRSLAVEIDTEAALDLLDGPAPATLPLRGEDH